MRTKKTALLLPPLLSALALVAGCDTRTTNPAPASPAPITPAASPQHETPPATQGKRVENPKLGVSYIAPAGYVVNPKPGLLDSVGPFIEFKPEKDTGTPAMIQIVKITPGSTYDYVLAGDNKSSVELLKNAASSSSKGSESEDVPINTPGLPAAAVLQKVHGMFGAPAESTYVAFGAVYGEGSERWLVMSSGDYPSGEAAAAFPEKTVLDFANSIRKL